MASRPTSSGVIMETGDIEETVRKCFDGVPNVDICQIDVIPFSQQFPVQELEMIRTAFTVGDFINEELDWAMERLIKCIGFLTLDILMPALTVCRQMETSVVRHEVPASPFGHRIVLVRPAPGSDEPPEGSQSGLMLDAWPMPKDTNFLIARGLGKPRQTCAKMCKFLTDKAQEIPTVILEMVPGYTIWDLGLYERSENFYRFLRINKDQPQIRRSFLGLIHETAEMLISVRNSERQQAFKAGASTLQFADFRSLVMEYFISESTRILLERLMNAPSRLQLQFTSRIGTELEEVPSLPQGFEHGHRELVTKLLMTKVSENVADFLKEAAARINTERAQGESDPADQESDLSDTDSETVSESSMAIPQLFEDACSGSSRISSRSKISSRMGGCDSGCSTSTCYPSSLSVRTQESLCLSTSSEETIANSAMCSNKDSANVKSTVAGRQQWRKKLSTICWKSKRRVSPSPVQAKPVEEEAMVATDRMKSPSLRSRLSSTLSSLLCCCKAQE